MTLPMDNLHSPLSVLAKAIHYKNLSGAAAHVGLSQPQLSRIIARLEDELGVVLLDRSVRRKSGWTPIAFKIADTYFQSSRKLTASLQQLTTDRQITQISIGILEGLIGLANSFCQHAFDTLNMQSIELNVYDLNELEDHFEKNELDLIFTCREPGRAKPKNRQILGYQTLNATGSPASRRIFSQFEYANHVQTRVPAVDPEKTAAPVETPRSLISNSLAVRKLWIEEIGGFGLVPSSVRKKKSQPSDVPVYLIGSDLMNPTLWRKFEQFRL